MDVVLQNAMQMHRAGNIVEAMRLYRQVLHFNPRHFQALFSLAMGHFQLAEFDDAARLYSEAASVNPASVDVWYNRGCALMALKRLDEAIVSFDRALALEPQGIEPLVNKAMALFQLGRVEDGLAACDQALAVKPDHLGLLAVKGGALMWLQRHDEAVVAYELLLTYRPDDRDALRNGADALAKIGRMDAALAAYGKALEAAPNDVELLNNRAVTLFLMKRYEDAIPDFEHILALDPNFEFAKGDLAYCRLQCADWRTYEKDRRELAAAVMSGKNAISPLEDVVLSASPAEQLRCARSYVAKRHSPAPPLWRGERYRHERIRVAYLSADFCAHPVGYCIAGVLEEHDSARFETTAISYGPDDGSAIRRRLETAFGTFIDVRGQTDSDAARLLRERETDIAIDLMGFTRDARTGILAYRPAPVQVQYLGFPGTMGADYIDYVLADTVVIPGGDRAQFTENIVTLPDSFFPAQGLHARDAVPTRAEAGLPGAGFVFCSFGGHHKLTPQMFDVWMRLLRAVDGAVLWLAEPGPPAAGNLRREAEARGVDAHRIVFAPFVQREVYIARLGAADLFLDTLPYGAHSTASEAIAAGLPLLTCLGTTFAGRVAASLLRTMGMPELIAESLDAYEAAALRLAREPATLGAAKEKLRRGRETSPLFDQRRFCRHLEAAYTAMWERQQYGEKPAGLSVAKIAGLN